MLPRVKPSEGAALICATCHADGCHRSRRHGFLDYLISTTGLRPWRCTSCDRRFYGWMVPVRFVLSAHCSDCGNFEVQRIAAKFGEGEFAFLWRTLGIPCFRCPRCRHHFFSVLRRKRFHQASQQSSAA
jgi:hypothetical protein